ncbi:MAG TPA: VOC family protein [Trebonia sp.]|nr:VOC family protein [Trebonia sp.]
MVTSAPFIGFIPARDLGIARAFYESTLGLRVAADTPFAVVLDAGGTMLRVTAVPGHEAAPFTIAGWDVPDIAATVRALAARGVEFTATTAWSKTASASGRRRAATGSPGSGTRMAAPCRSPRSPGAGAARAAYRASAM